MNYDTGIVIRKINGFDSDNGSVMQRVNDFDTGSEMAKVNDFDVMSCFSGLTNT